MWILTKSNHIFVPRQLEPASAADDVVPQFVAASWVRPLAYLRRRRLAPVRPRSPCRIIPGLPLLSNHIGTQYFIKRPVDNKNKLSYNFHNNIHCISI